MVAYQKYRRAIYFESFEAEATFTKLDKEAIRLVKAIEHEKKKLDKP